jgi:aminoglycoside phosphotransferase (APT) family kinase protein
VLRFLPGEVPRYPLPGWVWDDAVLTAAAALLRRLHDATAGFGPPQPRWRLPPREPAEVVCHNDFAPHNLVFRARVPVAVIDFDTSAPGSRAWDLAHLAYRIVPLTAPGAPDAPATPDDERDRRLALLCRAYGPPADAHEVLAAVPARLDALREVTLARLRDGGPDELAAHAAQYAADARYVRDRLTACRSGRPRTSRRP